jgi:hypothetical protein
MQFSDITGFCGRPRLLGRLAVVQYVMLKTGHSYHELGGTYFEQINKDQLQKYFVKRLQRLGLTVSVAPQPE